MNRYAITWFSSDEKRCAVTVVTREKPVDFRKPIGFDDYSDGNADDQFDVALYDDNGQSLIALRELVEKANAWQNVAEALDANAAGDISAADVCATGFMQQERMAEQQKEVANG